VLIAALRRRLQGSLRAKLLLLVLFPILLVAPATVSFAVLWSHGFNRQQLLHRVNTDLVVAHDAFARLQRDYLDVLERLSVSHAFYTAFRDDDAARLQDLLAAVRGTTGFDFVHLTDLSGRHILTGGGEAGRRSLVQQRAATVGAPAVGLEVFSAADLARESPELAERARLALVATPRSAPTDRTAEDRALVVRAVAPVRDVNGTLVALLDGGVIINRDFALVDAVRDLVYGPDSLPDGSRGTVTVFLDDVRISTNVPLAPGERALGTRVSQEVRDSVLGRGESFVNRAFVVNDWYVSAYEPIVDVAGHRVGMLYAGFLEAPFREAYERTVIIAAAMLLLGVLLAGAVAVLGARAIARPIEQMAAVARDLRAGRDRRIGDVGSRDELGELARQFDETLDLLKLRNDEVRRAADRLEVTVEARTAELRDKNRRLEETVALLRTARRQLVAAEKLAALGEVTAGVAHEINNPIAIIQGNLEVMRQLLGPAARGVDTEVELVLEQVRRIQTIVENLLRYSRPARPVGRPAPVALQRLVADTLVLVEHEAQVRGVRFAVRHDARNPVAIDVHELQQVLVNLLLNAVQASPPGGEVRVHCRDWESRGVVLSVEDQGQGIAAEHLSRVFDPFFTTKGSRGTGLGLSVSDGIVRGYGGEIRVRSRPGHGACFEVWLLSEPVTREDAA
jgi:two-component system NtrC family sensor kinase